MTTSPLSLSEQSITQLPPNSNSQSEPQTHYSIRLVHRTCIRYTLQECLDAIFSPMTVNPRYALWFRDTSAKPHQISNDLLFELRRSNDDKEVSFCPTRFTETQHRSIIKYNALCETSAEVDRVLAVARDIIKNWSFLTFVRSHRELATRLRNSLPLINGDTKYSEWFKIYRPPAPPLARSTSSASTSSRSSTNSRKSVNSCMATFGPGLTSPRRTGYIWRVKPNIRFKRSIWRLSGTTDDGKESGLMSSRTTSLVTVTGSVLSGVTVKVDEKALPRWSSSLSTVVPSIDEKV